MAGPSLTIRAIEHIYAWFMLSHMQKAEVQLRFFAENLRLLCSYSESVSYVCRALGINRQQFARYLNGEVQPSAQKIRKICDYFGVETEEILLPPDRFRVLVGVRPADKLRGPETNSSTSTVDLPRGNIQAARRYLGYYLCYSRSIEYPKAIICGVTRISQSGERILTKSVERLKPRVSQSKRSDTFKSRGQFILLSDRIFIIETEYLQQDTVGEMILYPTHKHPLNLIFGQGFSLDSGAARQPYMTPVVFEFAGITPNIHRLMRRCTLLPEDSPLLDERIRQFVLS
jgi:transcriptional regulator with XRE-family HTH domain